MSHFSLEQETSRLTFSEKEFLKALSLSPSGLSIRQIKEKTGLSRAGVYKIHKKLGQKRKYVKKGKKTRPTGKGQRLIAIFELTEKGKKVCSYLSKPSSNLVYTVDLGSEDSKLFLSFDALTPKDKYGYEAKYRYEAYWLSNPPLITPFLSAFDFARPTPPEIDVSLRIRIPNVSKDVRDAAYYFTSLNEKMCPEQYWFWQRDINWLRRDVAKSQGVWNTPYKDVGEICDLLMNSSYSIFVAMMLGLISARKHDKIYHQVILLGSKESEIYNLKFAPLNIFEFLLKFVPCIKKDKKIEFSDNHLGMIIFSRLLGKPEVKKWIRRCLKRDGRYWLNRIPFEKLGFKRNKEHVSDSWIFDENFPLSLGVFFSMEKEKWRHIGAAMNILVDMIMLNKLPSRLGDMLDYAEYTDDVILEAWNRVKGLWQQATDDRKLKRQISMSHRNEFNRQFFETQKDLRDVCCQFLDAINEEWRRQDRKIKGTKELSLYLPGEVDSRRPLELNPLYAFASDKKKRRMALVRNVLSKLVVSKSMRWGALLKETLKNGGTPHTCRTVLRFLLDNNYIEKTKRGVYAITQKSIDFLELDRYKRIMKIIEKNTKAILSDKKKIRILGSGRKRQKMIATEQYDPDKELNDYLKKLDYDDLMNKLVELSKSYPPSAEQF